MPQLTIYCFFDPGEGVIYSAFLSAVVTVALLSNVAADVPADGILTYSGKASAKGSNQPLYGERHFLRYRSGRLADRVVLYTCTDGSAFARKLVSYVDPLAPDFELTDANRGMREGLRTKSGARHIFFKENAESAEREKRLPASPGLVADAGFDEFIRVKWAALIAGENARFDFTVPSRLTVMSFQVKRVRSENVNGVPAQLFRLSLSGVIGWVLPAIDAYYSSADQVLLRYVGLSDLRNASGDNYDAEIFFPTANRVSSDEQAFNAARSAPVAACR